MRTLLAWRRMALAALALEAPGTGIDWNEPLSITTLPLRDCGSGE